MTKIYEDPNECGPRSFQEEAMLERATFERNVIASLELAESALTDAGNALAQYPGHDAQPIHDLASRVEDLRLDLGGET